MRRWVQWCSSAAWRAALPRGAGAPARRPGCASDPQRCLFQRDLARAWRRGATLRRSVRPGERLHGAPAEDSTRWVREADDRRVAARAGDPDRVARRRASAVQCSRRECMVLFRVRRPILLCAYRAVTMTQVFTKIRMTAGGIQDIALPRTLGLTAPTSVRRVYARARVIPVVPDHRPARIDPDLVVHLRQPLADRARERQVCPWRPNASVYHTSGPSPLLS